MKNLELIQSACSMAIFLFLRSIFGKAGYSETIDENLQWIVDALMENPINEIFAATFKKELDEGEYLEECASLANVEENLIDRYGLCEMEAKDLIDAIKKIHITERPLIILIGRSGTGKTSVAKYLYDTYGWKQIDSYTTRPKRTEDEVGHNFVTDEEFDRIPKEEIMAYVEYCGHRYCATRSQLNTADLYVVEPDGYKVLKKLYHDRFMFSINLTASKDILEQRMKKRGGCTDETIKDRLEQDDVIFDNVATDAIIDTSRLSIKEVGDKIKAITPNATAV